MNLERLGQWVGVAANIGVFAGFLLVAYQLHQNTISLQSNSVYASNQLFASGDLSMMGDTTYATFAHAMTDPAGLSPDELVQLWAYMSVSLFSTNVAYQDYRRGIISEEQWIGVRDTFVGYIDHPVGRILWNHQREALDTDRSGPFYEAVQERLDAIPPNGTQRWFRRMLEEVHALPVDREGG